MIEKQELPVADFRSDTVSKPSPGMRKAMSQAEVGDDVYGQDPTINSLQERVAKMFGHEAGLFLPSSTMGNLVSVLSHCPRGSSAIIGDQAHINKFEAGGISQNGGVYPIILKNNYNGTIDLKDILKKIPPKDPHLSPLALIALECTHNMMNGSILDFQYLKQVREIADQHNLKMHLDGSRVLNAAVAKGVEPKQFTKYFNSVNLCLSKGLGCPVGAVITGSAAFIDRAKHERKRMGGGMRQVGILGAAGHYALDRYKEQMKKDHQNLKYIRDSVKKIGDGQLVKVLCQDVVKTNISFFEITQKSKISSNQLKQRLKKQYGILINQRPMSTDIRIVTHLDVGRDKCQLLVKAMEEILMSTS